MQKRLRWGIRWWWRRGRWRFGGECTLSNNLPIVKKVCWEVSTSKQRGQKWIDDRDWKFVVWWGERQCQCSSTKMKKYKKKAEKKMERFESLFLSLVFFIFFPIHTIIAKYLQASSTLCAQLKKAEKKLLHLQFSPGLLNCGGHFSLQPRRHLYLFDSFFYSFY